MLKLLNVTYIDVEGKTYITNNGFNMVRENNIYSVSLKSERTISLKAIRLHFSSHPLMEEKMIANGYQTWTETKLMGKDDRIKPLFPLVKMLKLNQYGDYHFYNHGTQKGQIHAHEFTMFSSEKDHLLIASLNQASFYTVFERNYNKDTFDAYLDVEGLQIEAGSDFHAGHYLFIKGQEKNPLYDAFEKEITNYRKPGVVCNGWTSWYNYYTKIDNDIIHHNLDQLAKNPIDFDVFQIDDGYQKHVGDWLNTNEKFDEDLLPITKSAVDKGMRPGLWLAPFICEKESFIYKEKTEWLLRDQSGKEVAAGFNPQWSGIFYALDIYNEEVLSYLRDVFTRVFDEWQFKLVKLDFLYAVNLIPRPGKTRAMVMNFAMGFLDEVCKGEILACGIPIASALKRVEYCRIGADVSPYWEDKKLRFIGYRERISTRAAIYNTLNRYALNGRFFSNDPDVFIIREEDNRLNAYEKYTLFMVNQLLGDLVFFSDDISHYESEMTLMKSADPIPTIEGADIRENHDLFKITFNHDGFEYKAYVNMSDEPTSFKVGPGFYYSAKSGLIKGNRLHSIKAHESYCFLELFKQTPDETIVAILNDHMLLASGIENIITEGNNATIIIKDDYSKLNEIMLFSFIDLGIKTINGQICIKTIIEDIYVYQLPLLQ